MKFKVGQRIWIKHTCGISCYMIDDEFKVAKSAVIVSFYGADSYWLCIAKFDNNPFRQQRIRKECVLPSRTTQSLYAK